MRCRKGDQAPLAMGYERWYVVEMGVQAQLGLIDELVMGEGDTRALSPKAQEPCTCVVGFGDQAAGLVPRDCFAFTLLKIRSTIERHTCWLAPPSQQVCGMPNLIRFHEDVRRMVMVVCRSHNLGCLMFKQHKYAAGMFCMDESWHVTVIICLR